MTQAMVTQTGRTALNISDKKALQNAQNYLAGAFRKKERIDYSSEYVRMAYTYHYAAKHATLWYLILRRLKHNLGGCSQFISLGPGPGSEVFGIVESCRPAPGTTVEVHCLERQSGWQPIFNSATQVYENHTGVKIVINHINSVKGLPKGLPCVGSLFVSELIRDDALHPFLTQLQNQIRPSRAHFLDNVLCMGPNDTALGVPELLGFARWPNYLPKLNLNSAEVCLHHAEDANSPCSIDFGSEPKMCLFEIEMK